MANVQNLQYLKMRKDYYLLGQKQIQKYYLRLPTHLSYAWLN